MANSLPSRLQGANSEGASALPQMRCAVPNELDARHFKRWYPLDRRLADLAEPVVV